MENMKLVKVSTAFQGQHKDFDIEVEINTIKNLFVHSDGSLTEDLENFEALQDYLEEVQNHCHPVDNDLFILTCEAIRNGSAYIVLPVNQDDITIDFEYQDQ